MSDLWPKTLGSREESPRSRIVAVYDYRDEFDRLLYQKVRMEPKQFRQRRPVEGGGWEWSLGDCRRVLYRLPEILASDGLVVVVEGEKDADALHRIGYTATTNTEGAGAALSDAQKWRAEYSETLAGRDVVVIPDADEPGWSRAMFIVGSLLVHGASSVGCVGLPRGVKDASDWIAAGATCRDFRHLIRWAKNWR